MFYAPVLKLRTQHDRTVDRYRGHRMKLIDRILKDEAGATAIEYGLMAALISVAAITAMGSLGNSLSNTFGYVSNQVQSAQAGKL